MNSLFGMKVHVAPEYPRYTLPKDVPPPPGMTRQEFAEWSAKVCGTCSVLPDNIAIVCNDLFGCVVSKETFKQIVKIVV